MSSEASERKAVQYLERGVGWTARHLVNFLSVINEKLDGKHTAYQIGRNRLEDLINSPYQTSALRLGELNPAIADAEIDLEKFQQYLDRKNIPVAYAWDDNNLYFYTKDKSILDVHLEKILKEFAENPKVYEELIKDKTLNEEISEAKEGVTFDFSTVRDKELVR